MFGEGSQAPTGVQGIQPATTRLGGGGGCRYLSLGCNHYCQPACELSRCFIRVNVMSNAPMEFYSEDEDILKHRKRCISCVSKPTKGLKKRDVLDSRREPNSPVKALFSMSLGETQIS